VLANVCALKAPESATGDCYNIARGERTSLLVLLNVLRSLLGSETKPVHEEVRAGDVMHSWAETAKTEAHLGFKAKTELQNGLEQSIDWYRANL
jgi:UDP-glucose 4-epimerase